MDDNLDLLARMRTEFVAASNQFPHSRHQFLRNDRSHFPAWLGSKMMESLWYAVPIEKKFSIIPDDNARTALSGLARRAAVYAGAPGRENGNETDAWLELIYATLIRERPNLVESGPCGDMDLRKLTVDPFEASAITIEVMTAAGRQAPNKNEGTNGLRFFHSGHDETQGAWLPPVLAIAHIAKIANMDYRTTIDCFGRTGLIQKTRQKWTMKLDGMESTLRDKLEKAAKSKKVLPTPTHSNVLPHNPKR